MTSDVTNYLVVGAVLFVLGALGFLTRRNLIVAILCAEMMLQGVALNLVAFSYEHGSYEGQAFTIVLLTVAACEAALALALLSALYKHRKTLDMSVWSNLGEAEIAVPTERPESPPQTVRPPVEFPRLSPAGKVPQAVAQEISSHA